MNIFRIFIIFLILGFFLPVQSTQKNVLNDLFNQLKKVTNSKTAQLLEKQIWSQPKVDKNKLP